MDNKTFIKVGSALYGDNWQSELSRRLSVADRTIRRWVSGESKIPLTLGAELLSITHERIANIKNIQSLLIDDIKEKTPK